jgi:hypothetical protein
VKPAGISGIKKNLKDKISELITNSKNKNIKEHRLRVFENWVLRRIF